MNDLLIIQPAHGPLDGKPGPQHTRGLITMLIPPWDMLARGLVWHTRAACLVMSPELLPLRTLDADVTVALVQRAIGLVLKVEPEAGTPERSAGYLRFSLTVEPGNTVTASRAA